MNKGAKIYIAGHRGMVGAAIVRRLMDEGFTNLLCQSRDLLDLTCQTAVSDFFEKERPEYVIDAAARVGGILANDTFPAEFIRDNLEIQTHLIDSAYRNGCAKFLFLGSSCIYPKMARQPIREEYLLTGDLEPTNEWYAIAKIAGVKMCAAYRKQYKFDAISVMPTNLYGPGDNFSFKNSHVIPALLRKFHIAKRNGDECVSVWGSGTPMREFLFVEDLADAVVFLLKNYTDEMHINVGTGVDVAISEIAETVRDVVGFRGGIVYDHTKPDGTPRKLLDVSRIHSLGWKASTDLISGLEQTYVWFRSNESKLRT